MPVLATLNHNFGDSICTANTDSIGKLLAAEIFTQFVFMIVCFIKHHRSDTKADTTRIELYQ